MRDKAAPVLDPEPSPPPTRSAAIPYSPGFALGYLLVLASLAAVPLVPLDARRPVPLVGALLVGGAGWLLASWKAASAPAGRRFSWGVALGALLLRGLVLAGDPALSDDAWRYVWEGALVLEGESPWAHAPGDPERASARAARPTAFAGVNNPEVSAAYPPLTQLACAAVVAATGGREDARAERARRGMRVLFACCDLLVLWPLTRLLRLAGRPPRLACVWGFCPLVALEFAGSGHFDALGVLLLVVALATPGAWRAAAALAGGVLVKLLPVVVAPFLARAVGARAGRAGAAGSARAPRAEPSGNGGEPEQRARPAGAAAPLDRARSLRWLVAFALVVAPGLASPLLLRGDGAGLGRGLSEYALRWESFSLVYRWIERPLRALLPMDLAWSDPRRLGRALAAGAWLAFALLVWRRRPPRRGEDPRLAAAHAALLVQGAFLVLTPTLHPWYLTWIVPLLALHPLASWRFLVAAAPLAYWPLGGWLARGAWSEPAWLWPALALPFLALLARDAWRSTLLRPAEREPRS